MRTSIQGHSTTHDNEGGFACAGPATAAETLAGSARSSEVPRSHRSVPYISILTGILSLVLAVRLIGLNKGIWLDEYVTLDMIFRGSMSQMLQALRIDNHPPLYFVVLWLWSQIRTDEAFLRVPSLAFSAAALVTAAVWLRRYSRLASVLAVLYFGTSPLLLRYAQEIRPYGLLVLVTTVSFFFASRILKEPDRVSNYAGLCLGLTLGVATHLLGIMLLVSVASFLGASMLADRAVANKPLLVRLAVILFVPVAVFCVIYLLYLFRVRANTSGWWVPPATPGWVIEQAKVLFGTPQLFRFDALLQAHNASGAVAADLAIKGLLVISSLLLLAPGGWRLGWPFLLAALVYWLQILVYSWTITPMWYYRTILVGLVPWVGFVAVKLSSTKSHHLRPIAVASFSLICLASLAGWAAVDAHTPIEPWRQLSQSLATQWRPGDLVIFYPNYIEGPVLYYNPAIPRQSVLSIEIQAPMAERSSEIDRYVAKEHSSGQAPAAFLVIRNDMSVAKDQATYETLTRFLNAKLGTPTSSTTLGIISVTRFAGSTDINQAGAGSAP